MFYSIFFSSRANAFHINLGLRAFNTHLFLASEMIAFIMLFTIYDLFFAEKSRFNIDQLKMGF
jgi:hypothetical protein